MNKKEIVIKEIKHVLNRIGFCLNKFTRSNLICSAANGCGFSTNDKTFTYCPICRRKLNVNFEERVEELLYQSFQKLESNTTLYILQTINGGCCGVYNSLDDLKNGVDYWINEFPKMILSFEERSVNYAPEPNSWDWAYIPKNSSILKLKSGGATVPHKKFFGINLINIDWCLS